MNVREGNFDDELYVVEQSDLDFGQEVNRTPKRPKSGLKRTLVEGCEDEAAERKAKGVKHRSKVYFFGDFPGPGPSRTLASCVGMEIMSNGRVSETVPFQEVITNTC